jgi:hypothetical protein
MKWRKFFAHVLGINTQPPSTGLDLVFDDACTLATLAYAGHRWSRAALAGRMSQPRWTRGRTLMKLAGVLDVRGGLDRYTAPDYETAMELMRDKCRELRRESKRRNYVSPL